MLLQKKISWHFFGNFVCFSGYTHHSTILQTNNFIRDCNILYRVSHNTWDYKNALGRPLNDNVESWEVSHFEAKDHTIFLRGVRLWCVDFQLINFSKKPPTQNLVIFIYVVNLPNFWQAPARPTVHLKIWPTHLWIDIFILYMLDILRIRLNIQKVTFFDISFHKFSSKTKPICFPGKIWIFTNGFFEAESRKSKQTFWKHYKSSGSFFGTKTRQSVPKSMRLN
jgi:hypothetical protein